MPKKVEATDAQNAMRDMRRELGFSQQDLAVAMKKSVVAVARWESSRSPNGVALMELAKFARKHQLYDIWIRFQKELIRDQNIMAVMPAPEAYLHVVAL